MKTGQVFIPSTLAMPVMKAAKRRRRGGWFKVNLLSGRLYASVLGGEGFVAELGGEC